MVTRNRATSARLKLGVPPFATVIVAFAIFLETAAAVELHGHRGARGLLPENSIPGFKLAIEAGVDCLEFDVGMTADRKIVIFHNRRLNPDIVRKDGRWITNPVALYTLTADTLRAYDVGRIRPASDYAARFPSAKGLDGVRMPLLSNLLSLPQLQTMNPVCLNIEIKTSPVEPDSTFPPAEIARRLIDTVEPTGLERNIMVQSFDWRSLVFLRRHAPQVPLVFLSAQQSWADNIEVGEDGASPWTAGIDIDDFDGSVPRAVKHLGGAIWSPFFGDLNKARLDEAHALGLKVIVWTVNEEADMRRLIEMGVDGIITDYPGLGREVIDR